MLEHIYLPETNENPLYRLYLSLLNIFIFAVLYFRIIVVHKDDKIMETKKLLVSRGKLGRLK